MHMNLYGHCYGTFVSGTKNTCPWSCFEEPMRRMAVFIVILTICHTVFLSSCNFEKCFPCFSVSMTPKNAHSEERASQRTGTAWAQVMAKAVSRSRSLSRKMYQSNMKKSGVQLLTSGGRLIIVKRPLTA
jgi:hypothetical protein